MDCSFEPKFNQFDSLPDIGYKIIEYLMLKNEDLWKLLKYNTPDALSKSNLSIDEKSLLIYNENGSGVDFKVFRQPYLDDFYLKESSILHVYLENIIPINHIVSTVNYSVDCIVHNKVSNIDGYRNRCETMNYNILKCLNGAEVNGIGKFQFNSELSRYSMSRLNLWNNRNFYGYSTVFGVQVSNV